MPSSSPPPAAPAEEEAEVEAEEMPLPRRRKKRRRKRRRRRPPLWAICSEEMTVETTKFLRQKEGREWFDLVMCLEQTFLALSFCVSEPSLLNL